MATPIFEKKNVLVTGGAGFIGSHLCEELMKTSKVICVDNFVSGNQSNIDHLLRLPDFEFINHDITEPLDLEKMPELDKFRIKFQGIQEIYNLACPTSPKDFEKYKKATILANTVGITNLLEVAVKYKAKFLQASSSVVYGGRVDDNFHFSEDYVGTLDQLSPRACYDEGKKYAESIVSTYGDIYDLDIKIARIFRTYGPRTGLHRGEMVPDFIVNALEDKNLVIYGDDKFATALCFVSDIVDGLVRMMAADKGLGAVNLGSDVDVRLTDVCEKVIEMSESKSKVVFDKPLLFMTPLGLPDLTKAKDKLGWIPIVTLEQGLQRTIDFAKAHKVLLGV